MLTDSYIDDTFIRFYCRPYIKTLTEMYVHVRICPMTHSKVGLCEESSAEEAPGFCLWKTLTFWCNFFSVV